MVSIQSGISTRTTYCFGVGKSRQKRRQGCCLPGNRWLAGGSVKEGRIAVSVPMLRHRVHDRVSPFFGFRLALRS